MRLLIVLLLFAVSLSAQPPDYHAAEISLNPSYLRLDEFDLAGLSASFASNLNKRWSVVGDFGAHWGNSNVSVVETTEFFEEHSDSTKQGRGHGTCNPNAAPPAHPECDDEHSKTTRRVFSNGFDYSYQLMGGIRYRYKFKPATGYGQALAGWSSISDGIKQHHSLSLGVAGGVDIPLNDRLSLRIIEVGYLPIRVNNAWVNSYRISSGLIIKFRPWWGGFRGN